MAAFTRYFSGTTDPFEGDMNYSSVLMFLTFFTQKSAFETAGITSGFHKFIERLSRRLQ